MALIKLNNKAVSNATAFGSISSLGSMTFIKKLTASGSATLSFVDGASSVVLDDTYKEYYFTFNNIHPATDDVSLLFQVDTGSNTSYNTTITSTRFRTLHGEGGANPLLQYQAGEDQAQGNSFQDIAQEIGADNDQCTGGTLTLFNPSSSVFVKHFIANSQTALAGNYSSSNFTAGYFNTQTPLNKVQFKMSSGSIASGDICLYGIA